jgi:ClpP class serine protease
MDLPYPMPRLHQIETDIHIFSVVRWEHVMSFVRWTARPTIAITTLSGDISDARAHSFFHLVRNVLTKHRDISGFVLRVASGGGALGAAQAIVEILDQIREETGATIAIVVDDAALSAAFYIAMAGDFITAQPAAVLGSIGACMRRYDLRDVATRLGVRDVSLASSPQKLHGALPIQIQDGDDTAISALLESIDIDFRAYLRRRRPNIPSDLQLLDGRMFTGAMAHKAGFIDSLGGTVCAIAHIAQTRNVSARLVALEEERASSTLATISQFLPAGVLKNIFQLFG